MAAHVLERGDRVRSRREERGAVALLRQLDLVLLVSTLTLSVFGIFAVYAATRTSIAAEPTYYVKRQVAFSIVGGIVMIAVACVDYRRLEQWAYVVFGALVLTLLAVFKIGRSTVTTGTGASASGVAQRWIPFGPFQFQPSEFAVLGVIGVLAVYLTRHADDLGAKRLAPVLAMIAVPLLLVVKQPDLGTAIVMIVVVLAMLLVGGVRVRYIALALLIGGIGFVVGVELHVIGSSQLDRLTSFLHPHEYLQGVNYQPNLAKQEIGAGGFSGTGLYRGLFTNYQYLPEQSTDFIFATVGEQLGFAGSAALIALFGVMSLRMLRAAQAARDGLGRLVCVGVLAFLVFSVFQNIGMNVGLMPVTGIPLPLISYGGSAIIVFYAAVGLVLNIEMRRHRIR
jgi:rod shape determining protein RodA